jgi:peptidoglycan hydrolase CwlO-like protein
VFLALGLLVIGGGAAYARLHDDHLSALVLALGHPDEAAPAANAEEVKGLSELRTSQQQLQETLESIGHGMEAQQSQLKQMSDQLAELTAEVEALKAAPSPPPMQAPVAAVAAPVRRVAAAARRPSVKPKPAKSAGPVSVGGAPLAVAPRAGEQGAASSDQ